MSEHLTVGILLAAGVGRRFDPTGARNKLLQELETGKTVAAQSAHNLLRAVSVVVAVTNTAQMAQRMSDQGCHSVVCPEADQGMGASLACAARWIQIRYPQAGSVLIGLADMPFVQPVTIQQLVQQLAGGADIVQPVYLGRRGHPVGFSGRHITALAALHGDLGARNLLTRFPVLPIDVDDPGVIRDIDVPSDLDNLPIH